MVAQGTSIPRGVRIGLILSTGLVLLSVAGLVALRSALSQPALPVFGEVPAFALVDQDGQPFTRQDLDGVIHIVGFIYTSCPDICPAISARMASIQADLARAGLSDKVHLLSITVDPEYDTPERLAAYARTYGADTRSWRFLTGELHDVRFLVERGFLVGMDQVPTADTIHTGHHHGTEGHGTASHAAGHPGAESYGADGRGSDRHGGGSHGTNGTGSDHHDADSHDTDRQGMNSHGVDHHATEPQDAVGHSADERARLDYRVEHSGRVALVDREGRIRAYHDGNLLAPDDIMAQIRLLLAGR